MAESGCVDTFGPDVSRALVGNIGDNSRKGGVVTPESKRWCRRSFLADR